MQQKKKNDSEICDNNDDDDNNEDVVLPKENESDEVVVVSTPLPGLRRRNKSIGVNQSNISYNDATNKYFSNDIIDNKQNNSDGDLSVPDEQPVNILSDPKFFHNFFNDVVPYEISDDCQLRRFRKRTVSPVELKRNVILETVDAWSGQGELDLGFDERKRLKPLIFGGTFPIDQPTEVVRVNNNNVERRISDRKLKELLKNLHLDKGDDDDGSLVGIKAATFAIDAPF